MSGFSSLASGCPPSRDAHLRTGALAVTGPEASCVHVLSGLAGLFHDLGKGSVEFQASLRGTRQSSESTLYRHEWVSLRILQGVAGADTDEAWLSRLAAGGPWLVQAIVRDGLDASGDTHPFRGMPPLARAIGWLVVTHHLLPRWAGSKGEQPSLKREMLDRPLDGVTCSWNRVPPGSPPTRADIEPYWTPFGAAWPVADGRWRAAAGAAANKALEFLAESGLDALLDLRVLHLARTVLMLADHVYSAGPALHPVDGALVETTAFANTGSGRLKQPLVPHLVGVSGRACEIADGLAGLADHLPALTRCKLLEEPVRDEPFKWQDAAGAAAASIRLAATRGAFVVNMASTGRGKTRANAKIVQALADPARGMRMTYALGLRALTLQTADMYRNRLGIDGDALGVLVGGAVTRELFDFYRDQAEATGSESSGSVVPENAVIDYPGSANALPGLADPEVVSLVTPPVLVCTVDHMAPATESLRGGHQIGPTLRLLSSDLVLDEVDDYEMNDMPAIARLVQWAGMLGARIVVSSATMPEPLATGLFLAYLAGCEMRPDRRTGESLTCLWVDEYGTATADCRDGDSFNAGHAAFVETRIARLRAEPARQVGSLVEDGDIVAHDELGVYDALARVFSSAVALAHARHRHTDPSTGRRVSVGLVRMANVAPLIGVARAWYALGAPPDCRVHLCVYHSRFPLLARSSIEYMLDGALGKAPDRRREAVARAAKYPERDQIFVVLASPACEVGRDWDADWAVVEPSSMRSLIQLAGRVRRHRPEACGEPDVFVLDSNVRSIKRRCGFGARPEDGKLPPTFAWPGYERRTPDGRFLLASHSMARIVDPAEYTPITAAARIGPVPPVGRAGNPSLSALEKQVTAQAMLPREVGDPTRPARLRQPDRDETTWTWRFPRLSLTGEMQRRQPFRERDRREVTLAFLPDPTESGLLLHRVEATRRPRRLLFALIDSERRDAGLSQGPRIEAWRSPAWIDLLKEQANHRQIPLDECARRMMTVNAVASSKAGGWLCDEWLGVTEEPR